MNIINNLKENTIIFKGVNDVEDIIKMNKYLLYNHTDESVRYITSELVHNAVKTNSSCDVTVNCRRVETLIKGREDKYLEVTNYLERIENNENTNKEINISTKKMGGRGILSIISMGWKIMVEKLSSDSYRVSAINRAN